MIILMFIIIIGIIVLARIFSRSRGKDADITIPGDLYEWPEGYPQDDPYVTDPAFFFMPGNCANYHYSRRWDD
jgi:hypothetical protein